MYVLSLSGCLESRLRAPCPRLPVTGGSKPCTGVAATGAAAARAGAPRRPPKCPGWQSLQRSKHPGGRCRARTYDMKSI